MTTVKLKEKFNTRFGLTLIIETSKIIKVGEHFLAEGKEYILKGVPMMAKAAPGTSISVVVSEVN